MLTKISLVIFLLGVTNITHSQIVLEHEYEYASPMKVGVLKNGNTVYYESIPQNGVINIYKNDHTLLKSISLPFLDKTSLNYDKSDIGKYVDTEVKFISDQLFDLDNGIEILVTNSKILAVDSVYGDIKKSEYTVIIIDDNGSVLFEKKRAYIKESDDDQEFIFLDGIDYKMRIFEYDDTPDEYLYKTSIYKLPGSIYSITAIDDVIDNKRENLNAYPNPAVEYTKIAYKLPEGVSQGDLVIYNQLGQEIQRHKVGSAFSDILLYTTSFQEGTYIYHLVTGNSNNLQGKFVVMK